MSRAEDETPEFAADDLDAREDKTERRLQWRRARRRLFGAAAVFLLIGMLWQLGDDSRPPRIDPAAPSAETFPELSPSAVLQEAESELANADDSVLASADAEDESFSAADESFTAADEESAAEESFADAEKESDELFDKTESVQEKESSSAAEPVVIIESVAPTEEPAIEPVAPSAEKEIESAAKKEIESVAAADDSSSSAGEYDSFFAEISELSGFAVQLAALTNKKNAARLARKLQKEGFVMQISELHADGGLLHRVRAVGYKTRHEAELARRDIVALGYPEARVRDQQ